MKVRLVSISFTTPYTPQQRFLSLGYLHAAAAEDPIVGPCTEIVHDYYDPSVRSAAEIAAAIAADAPAVVGFTCYVWNDVDVFRIAAELKALLPQVQIITGGPQVSYHHAKVLREQPQIDFVAVGEGEHTFREFLQALVEERPQDLESIPGLAQRRHGKPFLAAPRAYEKNLEVFPSPYLTGVLEVCPTRRGVNYQTARGCPFVCTFCDYGRNQPYFEFSMDRVRAEFAFFKEHRTRLIVNVDPTFNYSRQRAEAILKLGIDLDLQAMHWFEVFPTLINQDLVELVQDSHLSFVGCGIQTCTPSTMRNIRRVWRPEKVEPVLDALQRKPNVMMSYEIIMGLPGDSLQNYRDTVSWTYARRPADLKSFCLAVLPRTPLEKEVDKWDIEFEQEDGREILSTGTMSHREVLIGKAINDWHRLLQPLFFRLCDLVPVPAGELIERWGWIVHDAGHHGRIQELQVHRIEGDLIEALADLWEEFVATLCRENGVPDVSRPLRELTRYLLYRRARTWVSTFFVDMRDISFNEPYAVVHRIYRVTAATVAASVGDGAGEIDGAVVPALGGNVDRQFFGFDMERLFTSTSAAELEGLPETVTEYLLFMAPDTGCGCAIAIDASVREFVERVDGQRSLAEILADLAEEAGDEAATRGAGIYRALAAIGLFSRPPFLPEPEVGVVSWQSAYPEVFREYH